MKESKREKKPQTVNVTYLVIIADYHMTHVLNNFLSQYLMGTSLPTLIECVESRVGVGEGSASHCK